MIQAELHSSAALRLSTREAPARKLIVTQAGVNDNCEAGVHINRAMPEEFESVDTASKALVSRLVEGLTPLRREVAVRATSSWYDSPARKGNLYVLRDGALSYRRQGRTLFSFNEGDLVGVENVLYSYGGAELASEFAVVVDEYSADGFFRHVQSSAELARAWNTYLAQQFTLFSIMLSHVAYFDEPYIPEVRCYAEGDEIIRQGAVGEEVFTLIEGHATVWVDGIQVGEIRNDEIFGVVAAISGTPRSATVRAEKDSMVVVLNKAQFKSMLLARPNTVYKLVEDMARALVSTNERLTEMVRRSM